jgi:putative flavoprotein involved in K+ transport
MYWLVAAGAFDQSRAELLAAGPIATRPLTGSRATISLQSLSAEGVVLLGRLTSCQDGVLVFSDTVADHMRYADEFAAQLRQRIEDYIARTGITAETPQPDPAEIIGPRLPDPPILSLDHFAAGITTVIWCTGVRGDFSWTEVPGLLAEDGQPLQDGCLAMVPGIYLPGTPFSVTRLSGTIHVVTEEANRIAADVISRLRSRASTVRSSC